MISKTIICVLCFILILTIEYLRYFPNDALKLDFKSEFGGRNVESRKLFAAYLKRFNKSYGMVEYQKRFRHFKKNLKKADRMNDGSNHARFGATKFSDWSEKELSRLISPELGGECDRKKRSCSDLVPRRIASYIAHYRSRYHMKRYGRILGDDENIPLKWDWRKHGVIGPIFDQRLCQICWAASIAGVMESMAAIHGLGLTTLSKQQLMDCTYGPGDSKKGCSHGRPLTDVFQFMCSEHTHLTTEAQYPLTFVDEKCKNLRGARTLMKYQNNCSMHLHERLLVKAIARGPVTALVFSDLFLNYLDGVISKNCEVPNYSEVNHAVQIVGYDTTADPPYYIVRNSWGEDWGEQGYARIAIGGNQCGIAYSIGILDVY